MSLFIDPFLNNGFMLNALAAGTLVAIACGIVGTFMVLKGLAFLGILMTIPFAIIGKKKNFDF